MIGSFKQAPKAYVECKKNASPLQEAGLKIENDSEN